MAEATPCTCGQWIRQRMWHGRLEWVHVASGSPRCAGPFATPADPSLRD